MQRRANHNGAGGGWLWDSEPHCQTIFLSLYRWFPLRFCNWLQIYLCLHVFVTNISERCTESYNSTRRPLVEFYPIFWYCGLTLFPTGNCFFEIFSKNSHCRRKIASTQSIFKTESKSFFLMVTDWPLIIDIGQHFMQWVKLGPQRTSNVVGSIWPPPLMKLCVRHKL